MSNLRQVELEYVYVTIPAEYICVYHRILAMLADFGEDMLKDCKATCKDRNSNAIDCFNMFNAAVAARKLGKDKLAETLIKYIKAKINQIYNGADNSTSFVFPVDEDGHIKAFVSCGERPKFEINPDDMNLYAHKFDNGFDEHFRLGPEDKSESYDYDDNKTIPSDAPKLAVRLAPRYEFIDGFVRPCAEIIVMYDNRPVSLENTTYQYYFDGQPVIRFNDAIITSTGVHNFMCVVTYKGETRIANESLYYETTNG